MFDEVIERIWQVAIGVVITGIVIVAAAIAMGYSVARRQPPVNWVNQPFTLERDAQGRPVAQVMVGFDDKGYVRWSRQPMPAQLTLPPIPEPPKRKEKTKYLTK